MTFTASLLTCVAFIGEELLRLQSSSTLRVNQKSDLSPTSNADAFSHHQLLAFFRAQGISEPILSEEGSLECLDDYEAYWIIDPLDGTRDYIAGSSGFCICLAHVSNGSPDYALIYAPYYRRAVGVGIDGNVFTWDGSTISTCGSRDVSSSSYTVVANFSYPKPRLDQFLDKLEASHRVPPIYRLSQSSAIKFMHLADGSARLYPKLGRLMQWDFAAGLCICQALGLPATDTYGRALLLSSLRLDHVGFFMGDYTPEFTEFVAEMA